jgi:hypothetical protein
VKLTSVFQQELRSKRYEGRRVVEVATRQEGEEGEFAILAERTLDWQPHRDPTNPRWDPKPRWYLSRPSALGPNDQVEAIENVWRNDGQAGTKRED